MTTPSTDPADEAGGEVIYSSEGLDPVPAIKPPPPTSEVAEDGETILDSDVIPAQLAFEVFQGKVYSVATRGASSAVKKEGDEESPLEKLARLTQEVQELEAQLQTTTHSSGSGRDFDEQMVELASALKSRLEATAQSTTKPLEQDDLTRLIRKQLDTLQQSKGEGSADKPAAGASSTDGGTGIVYELYGNVSNHPTTTLQERLVKLERLLGGGGSSSSSSGVAHKSLLGRLEELERLVQTVDAASLEQTATKAKVIRADLEAASKARNKLTATYKKEDSKMIQQLHQQMTDLEGLSGYLPSLVERLQQLAGLHVQASTFSGRLQDLESSANKISATISHLETTFASLQSNMVANIQTMEANMAKLDERLKGL